MGMDLSGIKPVSEKGHYFRSNVWFWRPLWNLVANDCADILSKDQIEGGEYNDGTEISAKQARQISDRILGDLDYIKDGIERYETQRKKDLEKNPDNFEASYPMDYKHTVDFAIFCKESGGFMIW